jgi:ribosome-binding protein aMBF1 (putative translation factor)
MATIRELRESKGWSQAKLAATLDVAPSTIFNWESGKFDPRFSQARELARVLEISLDDLEFAESDEADAKKLAA